MAWLFQGVLNAGLQILLSIFGGWLCAYLKLVDPEILSRQLNAFAMRAAFPAFIIHLLGIKTDLQDLRAWRALGVFILWVLLIHISCLIWHKLRRGKATVSHLGLNCLLLSTNNTGCIGWPVLIATVGRQGAALSMLLGVLFFIQLLPVTIACFEYQKWIDAHVEIGEGAATTDAPQSVDDALPPTADESDGAATGFPHEFRYCYWSMAEYHPPKFTSPNSGKPGATTKLLQQKGTGYPNYVEVHVDHHDSSFEALDHHCYGGSHSTNSSNSSQRSQVSGNDSSSMRCSTRDSSVKEWWQTGPPKWVSDQQKQLGMLPNRPPPLKRAKDSCNSLYSPFAVVSTKEADMQEKPQVVQSPRPLVSSITRRLSRTLSARATAAAAAAVAAPATMVRAASGKLKSQQQRDSTCPMSVPLMSEHEGVISCHGAAAATAAASGGGSSSGSTGTTPKSSSTPRTSDRDGNTATAGLSNSSKDTAGVLPYANKAAGSAVELHFMTPNSSEQELYKREQHLRQQLAANGGSMASENSFLGNRPLSSRVNSRTSLLPAVFGKSAGAAGGANGGNSKSKLGVATAAGAAGASGPGTGAPLLKQAPLTENVRHSPFASFVKNHPLLVHITVNQAKSFHLWLNLIAIALSVTGARKYLDPDSPKAIPALGFLDGVLAWFSSACIPVLLFANGVWMCGKDVFGGKKGQMQVTLLLLLKLTILPAVMVGLTFMCGMRDEYGLSLVLLTACPLAPLAFLVCQQYGSHAELATSVKIQGVLLMLPQMMAVIKIAQVAQLYDVAMLKSV